MTRVDAGCANPDLLCCAFSDDAGRQTLIALNRALVPLKLHVEWPGVALSQSEQAGPYQPNLPVSTESPLLVAPGAIVTLTTLPAPGNSH